MPPKSDFATLGKVDKFGDTFLAHVQYRTQNGVKKNICGPSRSDEAFAQEDLARMRAAAAVGKDRAQGFEILAMDTVFLLCFLNAATRGDGNGNHLLF